MCIITLYLSKSMNAKKKIIKVDGWSVSFGYISLTLLRLRIQITAHLWVERQIVVNTHFKKVRWSSALSFSWTLFGRYDDLQFWVAIEHFSEEICYKFIQSSFQRAPNNCSKLWSISFLKIGSYSNLHLSPRFMGSDRSWPDNDSVDFI